ncbi:MAG: hypothetical protein ABL955_12530, partial [Elusimicrobiota bacterium]
MNKTSRTMRVIATVLALALIHVSFGSQAWAQVINISGAVNAPMGGSAAAASGNTMSPANSAVPFLSPSNTGLGTSFSASATPAPLPVSFAANAAAVAPTTLAAGVSAAASVAPSRSAAVAAALAPTAASIAASKEEAPK